MISKCQQLSSCDVINTWAAGYCDIMLTDYSPRLQGSWDQHGAHLGPVSPRWAPCWPHEPCYQGWCCFYGCFDHHNGIANQGHFSMATHRHYLRWIYPCVLLRFHCRIEIDHSYSLHWCSLCCYSGTGLMGLAASGHAMASSTHAVPE